MSLKPPWSTEQVPGHTELKATYGGPALRKAQPPKFWDYRHTSCFGIFDYELRVLRIWLASNFF